MIRRKDISAYRKDLRAMVGADARRGEFRIKAALPAPDDGLTTASDGMVSELWLYDVIDPYADAYWGGISASMIVTALQRFGGSPVVLHINCPGGDVFEALAIYATLRNYSGQVTARVEGLSASAASFIMLAASTVVMEPNAMVMIHDALGIEIGNAADMRTFADLLDRTSDNIAAIYAGKGGGDAPAWRAQMLAETWFVGGEAVDAGLADSVADAGAGDTVGVSDRWDLGVWAAAPAPPAAVVPAPVPAEPEPPAPVQVVVDPVVVVEPATTEPVVSEIDMDALRSALRGVLA